MLTLPNDVRVFLATGPCDMRRQHDGLATLVRTSLGGEPESGHLFVFWNRRRTMCKVLFFDTQGYCLLAKRMERSVFRIPAVGGDASSMEITAEQLAQLLAGLDVSSTTRRAA